MDRCDHARIIRKNELKLKNIQRKVNSDTDEVNGSDEQREDDNLGDGKIENEEMSNQGNQTLKRL